jgi:hypothetical protein
MNVPKTRQFEITPAFAVPLVVAHLAEPEALNAELVELFEACEAQGDKYRNPDPFVFRNDAVFESNFTFFEWPQPCVKRLSEFCLSNLYRTIGELNGYGVEMLQRMHIATESWFHVTRRGGVFGAHNHPMHSWSGVYCVQHDGDDPESKSGLLTLISPSATSTTFIDTAVSNLRAPFSPGMRYFRLVPGQLLLFPSWLLHEVTPYDGDTRRITVAFNARFKLAGARPAEVPRG